ncbi:Transmembrane protein [Parasponia andersonii]|uniref:Transmembrane protein n=1 Tax=Parasponia andersonii TaxID=3476 RepID=A0A2P5CCN1_PARAD|nr:Transmembrane protein [Parasponia andersonii]
MLSSLAMASLSNLGSAFYGLASTTDSHPSNLNCYNKFLPHPWRVRASSSAVPGVDLNTLESAIAKKDSTSVKEALDQLSELGWAKKWSSQPYVSRRTTSLRELTTLGIKNAENLAIPSVRNDAAFLFTVVGTTGFSGVLAGQLPGDWGFFVPYLIGSISLIVLAVGSISPGLLQAAINGFSAFFPDYQERIARHEAAHFLVAYLLGLPILGYSVDIGKEHVNLVNERLEKLIYSGQLDAKELDRLAVVSMAGLAAEGLKYDKVIGQSADLFTLQRFINRSKPQISKDQQQNLTRWAVLFAGSLLKNNKDLHESLITAMSQKATVLECIETIEKAS